MNLQDVLELGSRATNLFQTAKQALEQFTDAAKKVGPTLGENDLAKLKLQLETTHRETMAMSKELDDAIAAELAKLG